MFHAIMIKKLECIFGQINNIMDFSHFRLKEAYKAKKKADLIRFIFGII